jgi:PAS domain S-box-containing protein
MEHPSRFRVEEQEVTINPEPDMPMQLARHEISILDSIPLQIAVLDGTGTLIQVNRAWTSFALDNDAPASLVKGVGTNYLETCAGVEGREAQDATAAYDGIRAVLNGDLQTYDLEYPCHSPTEKRWFLMTVTPCTGIPGHAVVSHLNITERKPVELRHSEFNRIFDQSLNGIYIFDAHTFRFIQVNHRARLNLGYSMDELRELTPVDISSKYTLEKFDEILAPLRKGAKEKIEYTTVHERRNGTRYPVEVHVQYMELEDIPVFVAIVLDITDRRQAEEQERLIQSTAEGIYGIDLNGNCTFCNNAALNLLGYENEAALLGTNIHERIHHSRADGTPHLVEERDVKRALRTKERIRADDEVFWRADGTSFAVEFWSYPITNRDKVTGRVVNFVDVTERNGALALLRQAKEMAENATATKSRFLAAASHDLRQPLQSLGLYLSVLMRQIDEPSQLDVAYKMRQSLDTMSELLNALLDISKLDGNAVAVEKKDLRIQQLLRRIVNDNIQQAKQKGLQLICSAEDYVVHTDLGLLERVLENFVTNAIRYTKLGAVTIDCQRDDRVLRISVSDTGVGIDESELDRVFEEYYQLDNPARDRRKGLGLGLAIVKHIAKLLDHPLDVKSIAGQGSTFSVEVPLGDQATAEIEIRAVPTVPRSSERVPKILLIDDDPSILDATTMLLEASGMVVHSALDGQDALAQVVAGLDPDMLVCDYRLPGETGVKVIRRIRDETMDDLPAILMTGDTSAEEIKLANLPSCTVLHKPADTDRLISTIENLVL